MENAILLHNLAPKDLQELIEKSVSKQLETFVKNVPIENQDELLTRMEASNLLKINISTLYNWTKNGTIIAYGIGNRVYYKRGELMARLIRIN
tara:strand:+ start:16970 stop:17248 length:279 start_codon:yes stop_codon:yes gene_type:complete